MEDENGNLHPVNNEDHIDFSEDENDNYLVDDRVNNTEATVYDYNVTNTTASVSLGRL